MLRYLHTIHSKLPIVQMGNLRPKGGSLAKLSQQTVVSE